MPDADASLAILNGTANFFDRFDSDPDAGTPSEAPSRVDRALSALSAPPGGNFFDRFDEPPAADHTLGRSARNIGQGAVTGAATSPSLAARSLPGPGLGVLPGTGEMADAAAWAVNNAPRLWGGKPTEMPAPGSPQQINDLLAQVGLGTQASPAQDAQDRIEQGIGQTAGAFVAPAAGVRALGGKALAEVGPYVMGKNLPLAATVGATAGATGSAAREIAPDGLKNVADVAGQLIGGGVLAGGKAGAQGAGRTVAKGIDYFRLPGAVAKSAEADLASGAIPRAAPGEPSEVGQLFQRQLDHADQLADAHVTALQQQSKQAAENLPSPSTQDSGQQMRGLLDQANRVAKTRESQLWQAIDPNENLGVQTGDLRGSIGDIEKAVPSTARPPEGEERAILDTVAKLPDVTPFHDFGALWSRVQAAIRQERMTGGGETPVVRRLGQIRDALSGALKTETENIASAEKAGAIHEGMAPTASRLSDHDAVQLRGLGIGTQGPGVGDHVFTPTGRQVGVRYDVVDLAGPNAPIASHTIDRDVNPAYPQELQPRDRSRAASAAQIRQMASTLQPERLGASASPQEGAPILGPDNIVESGNGRILALAQAYNQGLPSAGAYRAWLEGNGYNTIGMQFPALVRRRMTELSPQARLAFTRESNIAPTASLSATEQAAVDAEKLRPSLLSQHAGGDVTRAGNRDFARSFVRSVANPGEEGALMLPDGTLSAQGSQRMRNALLHRAYQDKGLVGAMSEAADEDLRAFGGSMQDAAGEMARLRGSIENGHVSPDRDLAPSLVDAARIVKLARDKGQPLSNLIAQQDAFNPISAQTEEILKAAYGENLRGRISRGRFGSILAYYADEAERQGAMADLLGEKPSVGQILAAGAQRYERNRGAETAARKPQSASFAGTGIGESGPGAQRPGFDQAGPASATGRAAESATASLAPKRDLAPFDQAAAARYAAAKQSTLERKQTFRAGPVGQVLAPGPNGTPYRLPDSRVPQKFASSPEGIQAYIDAAGGRPEAAALLHDHLASTLPRTPDGTIDPGAFPRWLARNRPAIDAFPELEQRFGTAAAAEQAVQDALDKRVADKKAQQRSATTLFIGRDPVTAVGRALSGGNGEANFRELTANVRGNPAAEMGLKRAVAEYARQQVGDKGFVGNAAFGRFLDKNRPALRQLFSDAHLDAIERLTKSFGAAHGGLEARGSDIVTMLAAEHAGELLSHAGKGIAHIKGLGIASLAVKKLGEALRSSGIHRFDELMDEAWLNPRLASMLVAKITPENRPALFSRFIRQVATIGAEAPGNAESRQRDSLDAVTRGVAAMAPGTAVTTRQLAQLSGRSDIADVRSRLVSRGMIAQRNGRYVRAETANAGAALAPAEVAQPKPGLTVNRALLDSVHKAIQQKAPTLRRQSLQDLGNEIEARPSPYYGTYRPGGLLEHTVAIGQGSPMTHDVVNLLRRSGGIPREEWSRLAAKGEDWARRFGIEGPSPSIRREEAVAQAYNRWRAGEMQLPPGLRRIMGGIPSVATA